MKDRTTQAIALEPAKVQFLEQMASRYGLPDIGKVVRCLVDYAREHPSKHQEIFSEPRCLDC